MAPLTVHRVGHVRAETIRWVVDDEFVTMLRGEAGRRFLRKCPTTPHRGAILFAFEKVILGLDWRVDPAETDDEAPWLK